MAKLTRSGVAHDLNISPYKQVVKYDNEELMFVFSSEFYRKKFEDKIEDNRNKINKSLSNRFGFEVRNNLLADIKLYLTTETRGFLILGKEIFLCPSSLVLSGEKVMKRN